MRKSRENPLQTVITDPAELFERLKLPADLLPAAHAASEQFGLRVPRNFVDQMQPGDINDPLLQQVLPRAAELIPTPGYTQDPLQEHHNPIPGLLHKYPGRVLLTLTGACAINCRYCFRRHFPYGDNNPGKNNYQLMLQYIRDNQSINEVILSGGDPLVLKDEKLTHLIEQLASIEHLTTLRIHTRMPVVAPERITATLIATLIQTRLQPIIIIHANHANEISAAVTQALKKLHHAGIMLMNQSVLLKGVNDNADCLIKLSQALFKAHVLPYYLHQLDPVQGAAHFAVSDERAGEIIGTMRRQISGYLVPKLVREVAGEMSKTALAIAAR